MVDRDSNQCCQGTFIEAGVFDDELDGDDGLSDAAAAEMADRTILITALAGALTAATVLCGWGLQVSADEIARLRGDSLARGGERLVLAETAYFHAGRERATGGGATFDFGAEFLAAALPGRTDDRVANLERATLRASEYARKRSRLERRLARLDELSVGRSAERNVTTDIQRLSEYEAVLAEADKLRGELHEMRAEELRLGSLTAVLPAPESSGVGVSASAFDFEFRAEEAVGVTGLNFDGGSAAAHCRSLLAQLESNRLSTIAELAFIDESGEFPY